jgi:gamma-glutamyltranspeptidase/glutathione hydrolase
VSRALSRDLRAGGAFLADRDARRIFGKGGGILVEGDALVQPDLANILGSIRQRGGADFFSGTSARTLSDGVAQLGGSLPVDALRKVVPQASPPMAEDTGTFARRRVYAAPAPAAGAMALAGWKGQPASGPVPTSSGGFASAVAVDGKAGAAACAFSMGQLFGARVVVPGTGVLLGAPTPDGGSVSPLIIANPSNGEFTFAGAGGGGPTAPLAVGAVARATVEQEQPLSAVLASRGGQGGYVNVIVCPSGLRSGANTCRASIDPASAGLALSGR